MDCPELATGVITQVDVRTVVEYSRGKVNFPFEWLRKEAEGLEREGVVKVAYRHKSKSEAAGIMGCLFCGDTSMFVFLNSTKLGFHGFIVGKIVREQIGQGMEETGSLGRRLDPKGVLAVGKSEVRDPVLGAKLTAQHLTVWRVGGD